MVVCCRRQIDYTGLILIYIISVFKCYRYIDILTAKNNKKPTALDMDTHMIANTVHYHLAIDQYWGDFMFFNC